MPYRGPKLSALHGDALKKRYAQLAKDPGNRKLVPTKYLTTEQAKQRVLNTRLNAPVVPGDTMTNRDLAHEANAATQTQYGSLMASQALQPKQTNDYYAQYLNTLRTAQDSQAAQGRALATTLGNIGAAGQQQAQQENTRVQDQAAADAKIRGATQDPSLAANAANAAQVTRNIATGGANTAGLLSQNAAAYLTALQASGAAGQLGALNRNVSDAQQTKKEAGAFKTEYVGKRRSEESQNVATSALANVNAAAKSASAQTARTNAQTQRQRAAEAHRHNVAQENKPPSPSEQKTAADLAFFKKHGYYPPTGAPKKPKGPGGKDPAFLAPAGQQSVVQRVHKVAQYLNSDQKWPSGPRKGQSMTWNEKVNHLSNGLLEPQNIVDAAKSLAQNQRQGRTNTLGPSGASALHSAGAQVHGHFKYVSGKRKKS